VIEGFSVTPTRLRLASGQVRTSGRQLAAAGRTVSQILEGVAGQPPGSLTSAAALGLASAARTHVGSLAAGMEALAAALDAAASRYASTDTLVASVGARR